MPNWNYTKLIQSAIELIKAMKQLMSVEEKFAMEGQEQKISQLKKEDSRIPIEQLLIDIIIGFDFK